MSSTCSYLYQSCHEPISSEEEIHCCNDFKCNYNNPFYSQCIDYNPKHGYVVIIYSGKTDSNANSILANYIASGVRLSGMNVAGPFDISLANEKLKDTILELVKYSDGIIIGSGVYNGNIEPSMTEFFDNKAGAGFNSSFLASKVAGQFATAADCGTGGQLVLNSLSRLMQTFGANIITGGASRSNVQGHGSGSWHTAQGILGIVVSKTDDTPAHFTNKYIQEDARAYGERIGQIASFFRREYIQTMNPTTPKPNPGNNCYNIKDCHNISMNTNNLTSLPSSKKKNYILYSNI